MKKILTIAAAAALMLSSCTKNEVVPSMNGTDEITFSSYAGREVTKAESFWGLYKVRAFYNGTSYFEDSFINGEYTYTYGVTSTKYYWPKDIGDTKKMKFYAVSPETNSITADSTIANFTATGAVDLLVAKTGEYTAKAASVPLHFSHALSQINKITLQGKDGDGTKSSEYAYTIDSLSISGKKSGTYSFGTSAWTPGSTDSAYVYATKSSTGTFEGNATKVYKTAKYLVPQEELTLTVRYKITKTVSGTTYTILDSTTKTGTFTVAAGTSYALTITLPNDNESSKIIFNAAVTDWGADQGISIPEWVPVFSVGADKKVKFTKGNLYWDGSDWKMEANQYDCPSTRSTSHVGHFFWNNDQSKACAESYTANPSGTDDYFFCGEGHELTIDGQSGLYALSNEEWDYLFLSRPNAFILQQSPVTVDGKSECLIIAPDGYSGTIASSYTATEWIDAEADGLVCLPAAGMWSSSAVHGGGSIGYYWSSTPCGTRAYYLNFNSGVASISSMNDRNGGKSVRLVYSAE